MNLQVKLYYFIDVLKNNSKLNALMFEVFDEHLILNYERVTSKTQSLKKI